MSKAVTGSITGMVKEEDRGHLPVAYAIIPTTTGEDTVTTADVDSISGQFMLSFLPENIYEVSVQDTLGHSKRISGVTVSAGSNTDVGELDLQ
jgi:hypothetical protein